MQKAAMYAEKKFFVAQAENLSARSGSTAPRTIPALSPGSA
jgi:hypothetical protein